MTRGEEPPEQPREVGSDAPATTQMPAATSTVERRSDMPPPPTPEGLTTRDSLPTAGDDGAAPPGDESPTRTATEPKKPRKTKKNGFVHQLIELPILILFAFIIAVLIKTFLLQAFFIPSGSMVPTLRIGDRVLVEKLSYTWDDPSPQDVVVFARSVFGQAPPDVPWYDDVRNYMRELLGLPTGTEEDYIKRIVAVGGDSVRYEGKPRTLFVNGEKVEEPYIKSGIDRTSGPLTANDCERLKMEVADGGCRVPAGRVFVMGDNRNNSADSRDIGPVDEDKIVGRAFVVIWPPEDFGGL
ncbi:MAG: signal peptidase I [Actinomycetota bacterium]|nr:signal peptidase I [Actinomycetota bacterium]